ncbi:MAG: pyridoxamine 5-phosphate oxidase family protein [Ilumatobacteraceae bacterium]|nr:pyridoxamine 5-phosphate oxidase family protein [Ilumatobacteraceae bacterium]
MASIGTGLALTQDELDEMMTTSWNMRVATIGPGTRVNVTPLWFGWAGGAVYFYCRGQKIANLRRNPVCTVLVDRNERFAELQGAMLQGAAEVLETVDDEAADANLDVVRRQMGAKYAGGHGEPAAAAGEAPAPFAASARGRAWRWVRFTPTQVVTWDNHKIGR